MDKIHWNTAKKGALLFLKSRLTQREDHRLIRGAFFSCSPLSSQSIYTKLRPN